MPDIKHSLQISATPEQVYALAATGKGFAQWWATDITELTGAVVELGFFNRATIYRLRPTVQEPPASVEWICESGDEWSGTRIAFHLEATKTGTLLRFAHAGWRAETDYFTSCNTTWGELMFRLKRAAESKGSRSSVHTRSMDCLEWPLISSDKWRHSRLLRLLLLRREHDSYFATTGSHIALDRSPAREIDCVAFA